LNLKGPLLGSGGGREEDLQISTHEPVYGVREERTSRAWERNRCAYPRVTHRLRGRQLTFRDARDDCCLTSGLSGIERKERKRNLHAERCLHEAGGLKEGGDWAPLRRRRCGKAESKKKKRQSNEGGAGGQDEGAYTREELPVGRRGKGKRAGEEGPTTSIFMA